MMIARIQNTAKQLLLSKDCKWFNCFLLVLCPPQSNTQVIMVLEREHLCWTFVRLQRRTLGEESVGFVSVSSQLFVRPQSCCHNCCVGLSVFGHGSGSTIMVFLVDLFVFCPTIYSLFGMIFLVTLLGCFLNTDKSFFLVQLNAEFVQFSEV